MADRVEERRLLFLKELPAYRIAIERYQHVFH